MSQIGKQFRRKAHNLVIAEISENTIHFQLVTEACAKRIHRAINAAVSNINTPGTHSHDTNKLTEIRITKNEAINNS